LGASSASLRPSRRRVLQSRDAIQIVTGRRRVASWKMKVDKFEHATRRAQARPRGGTAKGHASARVLRLDGRCAGRWWLGRETHAQLVSSSNLRESVKREGPSNPRLCSRAPDDRRWNTRRRRSSPEVIVGAALRFLSSGLRRTSSGRGIELRDRGPRACRSSRVFGGSDQSRDAWQSPIKPSARGCPGRPTTDC